MIGLGRRREVHQPAGRRQEAAIRILRVDARLKRVAVDRDLVLCQRQRFARRDTQLPFDQVEAGDHLGDRMLDLQPRVHLHEIEAAVLVGDELDGAGAHVVHGLGRIDRGLAHRGATRRRHAGRRCFLEHLLMPALHRAVALEQMHDAAVRVAEHLDLDVPRLQHVLLDQHVVVAERALRLALARRERGVEVLGAIDATHALAAPTRTGLDQDRIADAIGLVLQQRRRLVVAVIAGRERHAGLLHQRLRRGLETHRADRVNRRADEHDTRLRAGLGEVLVLRQETVAGMDRLGAGLLRRVEDAIDDEIRLARRRRPDQHRLVGESHVTRVRVRFRIHRDGGDTHLPRGLDDATGDFTAVGYEDLLEHQCLAVKSPRAMRATQCDCVAARPCGRWSPRFAIRIFLNIRFNAPR